MREAAAARANFNRVVELGGTPLTGGYAMARDRAEYREAQIPIRRQALVQCVTRMGQANPGAYIDAPPEASEPIETPIQRPGGVTPEMDEADFAPPLIGERRGAESKNFARYGYCDRSASKDGGHCCPHA